MANIQLSTATTGTVTPMDTQQDLTLIHDAAATVTLTIPFPATPKNGQSFTVCYVGGITTLTLTTLVGTIANTITTMPVGGTIVWSYSDTGVYVATLSGAFTSSKTAIQLQNTSNTGVVSTFTGTSNFVSIATYDSIGASANGKLTEAFFEIRVYN